MLDVGERLLGSVHKLSVGEVSIKSVELYDKNLCT